MAVPGYGLCRCAGPDHRFDTNDHKDLVSVYDHLIGGMSCDPFAESSQAVDAFEEGKWGRTAVTQSSGYQLHP